MDRDDLAEVALLGLVGYVSFAYYPVVGWLAGTRGTDFGPLLRTPVDDAIPYLPVFALSYGLAYIAPMAAALAVLKLRGMPAFRRVFFGYLGLLALHYAFWIAFPSSARGVMLAPEAVSSGSWAPAVRVFYGIAPPWNAFPSFHVAGCWYFYRVMPPGRAAWSRLYLLWFLTMFASTLALKLHWFMDSVFGWLAAEAFYRAVHRRLEATDACAWTWDSTRARLTALGAPLLGLAAALGLAMARLGYPR
ncbi:MAG: phosphatase PAP2 family protein [Elusimicrobia bacterium]|nr:phosphatase PAP2 family protein [Elusimicrobiota bacterium]